jgi:hypothetical protein
MSKKQFEMIKQTIGESFVTVNVGEHVASELIDLFENNVVVYPEDTDDGIGFMAVAFDLNLDPEEDTKTKPELLRDMIETYYIVDDDSCWEKCERLGKELRQLSDDLLASAERGKARLKGDD